MNMYILIPGISGMFIFEIHMICITLYIRDWEPADTFTLYKPDPWPQEHTDKGQHF